METIKDKRIYSTPQVERVELDNEISLVLQSDPLAGPGETAQLMTPEYFNNDPFKTNMG